MPEHLSDEKVDGLIQMLLKSLVDVLLPFQLEGVRFGLHRGVRCFIADEMGLGKTLQVSQYSGRIHVYTCISGVNLRPRALFESFRLEKLGLQNPLLMTIKNGLVSQYSGRIHVYTCISGVDLRPRTLFESFRPEKLGLQHPLLMTVKNGLVSVSKTIRVIDMSLWNSSEIGTS